MNGQWGGLGAAYEAALERFVDAGEEADLEAAHAFSREAFGDEMSVLDVVDLHRQVVEQLLVRESSAEVGLIAASFTYLCEALSTFEMTQRGYWEAQHHAEREHAIALSLQHDLLPRAVPEVTGLDLSVRYLPGEAGTHAGGDWYDVFELDANRIGLVVGDVTGHGVAAAAAMGRLRVAVLAHALAGLGPADVIKRVDTLLDQLATGEGRHHGLRGRRSWEGPAGRGQRWAPATDHRRARRRGAASRSGAWSPAGPASPVAAP